MRIQHALVALLVPALTPPHPTTLAYRLRVDSADLSRYQVEIRIEHAPDTFTLALAVHPEYDDRFYQFVESLAVEGEAGAGLVRSDSNTWRITLPGGSGVVRYTIHLPAPMPLRSAWRPFLGPTGGLVGGIQSFMYVVGLEQTPSRVTLDLPASWEAATALPAIGAFVYRAGSADELVESPILVGRLHTWSFAVRGIRHRVVYWPRPDAAAFDTSAFVAGVNRIVEETFAIFGRAPYRDYTFLFQDGARGALEHPSSVTLGVSSAALARDAAASLGETAHEFFHTWNLMSIRPAEHHGISARAPEPSGGLWFSEGVTMFYADLLTRRAGYPRPDTTRVAHLEAQIAAYLANPGNVRFSAEAISRASDGPPGGLGDYQAGPHLTGELIGAMLDLAIRDATGGRRSLDDVMRLMNARFGGAPRGFTSGDIEAASETVCGCDLRALFDGSVRSAGPIDFARYLALAGLTIRLSSAPALDAGGHPAPDARIWAWTPPGETTPRLMLSAPASVWGRAGLHTGDVLARWNGTPPQDVAALRAAIGQLRIGDSVAVEVMRPSGRYRATVVVTGYERPVVRIADATEVTARQSRIRMAWSKGLP